MLGQAVLQSPGRMAVGSGCLVPCQCAELDPGAGQDPVGRSLPPWLGRCREEPGSWKGHEEALELFAEFMLCLKFSLQPSFFLQIHPGIYCFSFLLPAPDFWAALPREGAFGRLRGCCHASKHPSGALPASCWIQPGPVPGRAAPGPWAERCPGMNPEHSPVPGREQTRAAHCPISRGSAGSAGWDPGCSSR